MRSETNSGSTPSSSVTTWALIFRFRSETCWRIRVPASLPVLSLLAVVGLQLLRELLDPERPEDPLGEETHHQPLQAVFPQ